MRVRIRFVLTLTLVVSVILATSFFIIYTLSGKNRKADFDNRLWAHAYNIYKDYYNIKDSSRAVESRLNYYLPGSPTEFNSVILDSAYNIIKSVPDDSGYSVDTNKLALIRETKEYYFSENESQGVGLYFNQYNHESYVIASGRDKYGLARLYSLRLIMVYVSIGSLILMVLFTFLYVVIVTRPLVSLSFQIC